MIRLDLERAIETKEKILGLVDALGLLSAPLKRDYVATLSNEMVQNLIASEDSFRSMRRRLAGKRAVPLTKRQKEIVAVVKYLHDFEEAVKPYLDTDSQKVYAIEYILAKSDPALARSLDFEDLQTLKRYTQFADELVRMYAQPPQSEQAIFSQSADDVAKMLIGKTLTLPADVFYAYSERGIREWQSFLEGRNPNYVPLEAIILETEGFETSDDLTPSRYCMLAAPGQLDTMPFRGQTFLNVGTSKVGVPSCVIIRAVSIDGTVIDGPGKVGAILYAEYLKGKILRRDIPLEGATQASSYIPGENYSTGRYRVQLL